MSNDRPNLKNELDCRLRCAAGHLRGVRLMLERGDGCEEVVRQLSAVQGALREVNQLLLKQYINSCLRDGLREPDILFRERYIDEVRALYQKLGAGRASR